MRFDAPFVGMTGYFGLGEYFVMRNIVDINGVFDFAQG